MKAAIAYIRVSTQKQGKSGLGLEAQQALIQRFADQEDLTIVQSFTEVQAVVCDDRYSCSRSVGGRIDRPSIGLRFRVVLRCTSSL